MDVQSVSVVRVSEDKLDFCEIWLGNDGIVRLDLYPDGTMDLAGAKAMGNSVKNFGDGHKIGVLVDIRDHNGFISDREARSYLAGNEFAENVNNVAILIGSQLGGFLGNFFIRVNRPLYRVHIFTEESKAIQWIKRVR